MNARQCEVGYWRAVAVTCRAISDVSRATAVAWSGERHIAEAMNRRADAEHEQAAAADLLADAIEAEPA